MLEKRYRIITTDIGFFVWDSYEERVVENYVCPREQKYRDKVKELLTPFLSAN